MGRNPQGLTACLGSARPWSVARSAPGSEGRGEEGDRSFSSSEQRGEAGDSAGPPRAHREAGR